jgi:hypothetical protein
MSEFHAWVQDQQALGMPLPTATKDLALMEAAWNAALERRRQPQQGQAELAVMYLNRAMNAATGSLAPCDLMAMAQVHATLAVAAAMSAKEPLESYTAGFEAGKAAMTAGGGKFDPPLESSTAGYQRWHGAEATPGQVIPRAADVLTPKWACTIHGWASNFTPCPECTAEIRL